MLYNQKVWTYLNDIERIADILRKRCENNANVEIQSFITKAEKSPRILEQISVCHGHKSIYLACPPAQTPSEFWKR